MAENNIENLRLKITEYLAEINELRTKISKLEDAKMKLDKDLSNEKSQSKKLRDENGMMQIEIDDLKEKITSAKKKTKSAN